MIHYILCYIVIFSPNNSDQSTNIFFNQIFFFTNYSNEKHMHDNIIDRAMHCANIYSYVLWYIFKKIIILIIKKHVHDKIFGYSHVVCIHILIYYTWSIYYQLPTLLIQPCAYKWLYIYIFFQNNSDWSTNIYNTNFTDP